MTPKNRFQDRVKGISEKKIEQAIRRAIVACKSSEKELREYAETMQSQVKIKTLENYLNSLSKIIVAIKKPPSKLDNSDVRHFFNSIQNMSNGTKYAAYQALRSIFNDLWKYDRQMDDDLTSKWERIMKNVKRPGASKRLLTTNDLITPELLTKLIDACRNPRDKAFIMCLSETGARLSEILSMEVCDIALDSKPMEIKIRHSKTQDKKGRRPVYVFRAEPLLKAWLEAHPLNNGDESFYTSHTPVWVTVIGSTPQVITPNTANRILELVKERAGINKERRIFAHLFRHSRASDLHQNYGLDIKEIKELLGHSRIETTDGYLTLNRNVLIQKLQGGKDNELEERKQKAIKKGQPVPCSCGVMNDPSSAFCYKCGRVVNQKIAHNLVKQKESQEQELADIKAQLDNLPQALAQLMGVSSKDLKKALEIKRRK